MRAVRRNRGRVSSLDALRSTGALLVVLLLAGPSTGDAGASSQRDEGERVRLAPPQPVVGSSDRPTALRIVAERVASPPSRGKPALPAGAGDGWWSAVQRGIADSEYRITWQDGAGAGGRGGAYQAPNRAQGLRTTFEPEAIRIGPRRDEEPGWSVGISLVRVGPEGAEPVDPAALAADGDRIDYRRGAITETWVNDPHGLSQRIAFATPPSGGGTGLRIGLAVFGNVLAAPFPDGKGVEILTGGGAAALRLADLEVTDARGTGLGASLALARCGSREAGEMRCDLEIVAETAGATWPVTASLVASSPSWSVESNQENAAYGASVGGAGDVNGDGYADVVVGAPLYDNGQEGEGRAFVYHGSAAGLSTRVSWSAEADQASARFGGSVAGAGDVNGDGFADVLVGAPSYDDDQTDEGRAFLYFGGAAGLSTVAGWSAEGNQAYSSFGHSVAGTGDVNGDGYADVLVGASGYDNGQTDEGRAVVYLGGAAGPSTLVHWSAEGNQASASFGSSVAGAGDVNGDGYADVIVGAPWRDNGQTDEGQAFVYLGSSSGLGTAAAWTGEGNQASARYGISVAGAGDVNGDGYSDVILGASLFDNGSTDEGRAFVYHGSASGLSSVSGWSAEGDQAGAALGSSVAGAGDVNGDGYSDVIVGAPYYDVTEQDEGQARIYHGSASGIVAEVWAGRGFVLAAHFGGSVAGAGDVNGDGYGDVIVGAPIYSDGQSGEGRAYVYHGSADGPTASPVWAQEGNLGLAAYGSSVASAGDVNGDGWADVIVGAYGYDNGAYYEGGAFVYPGSAAGLSLAASWSMEGGQADANCGASVAGAGDVNGDGFADVLVGATGWDNGELNEGRGVLYFGTAAGLALEPGWSAEGGAIGASFGGSVAGAGDVNGDGYADVIVGASHYSGGQSTEGRASVFHGNRGTGRRVAARQLRGDGSAPVQPWGGSFDATSFSVQSNHVSPFGREAVRFEVQACPRGVPFGHATCVTQRSPWSDSTATPNGVLLSRTVSGLAAGTLYRWRARTLRMPYSVLAAHTASPPNPAHGPWWRLSGAVVDADVRTRATATLDVSRTGSGAGLVTSDPAGIDCGTDCSQAYPLGTVVTLGATPAAGSLFTGWTGEGCSGTGTCVLTMSQARTVTAVFDLISGPFLSPLGGPIVVGGTNTFAGSGFTAGTVLKLFVSTATGPLDTNTSGWTPTTWTPTTLTWEIPPTVTLGQGFATVQVVNTDEGYVASNLVSQLLYGDAADGLPTILTIGGAGLRAPDPSLPGAHVETVLAAGSTVTIGGTGFNAPLVNLFTANGNAGPLTPLAGGTATGFQVVIPAGVPAGPGTFQVVNTGTGYKVSNAVDAVLRARITVTSVSIAGSTVNVVGDGFCSLTVINLFNVQGSDVVNLGGLSGGSPLIPLTVTDAQHMSFTLPAGTQSGPAYVQALNPPYTPYTSSGTDPGGAFTVP